MSCRAHGGAHTSSRWSRRADWHSHCLRLSRLLSSELNLAPVFMSRFLSRNGSMCGYITLTLAVLSIRQCFPLSQQLFTFIFTRRFFARRSIMVTDCGNWGIITPPPVSRFGSTQKLSVREHFPRSHDVDVTQTLPP